MQITTLSNGTKIISEHRAHSQCVSTGVFINTGAAFESKELNGISHFLEHMFFKGTKKRSALEISEQIEDVGGQLNAYTGREFTAYYAKVLKEHTELAVDIILDMMQNATFSDEELTKEREVVIQEIKQAYDDPTDIIFDYFQNLSFGNQALGRPILGEEKTLKTFDKKILKNYIKSNYGLNNMIFCAIGNIKHDEFVKMIEARVDSISLHTKFKIEDQKYTGGFMAEKRPIKQTHVVLGFEGVDYNSLEYYTSLILSSILGGGMSSRLFVEIREKLGLAYSVYSFGNSFSKSGMFGIYAGSTKEELKTLMPTIITEIKKIRQDKVLDAELDRAKNQLKASMLMALESSSSSLEIFSRQHLLFGRVIPNTEMIAKIEAVDKDKIIDFANKVFSSRPSYCLLGDLGKFMDYDKLIKEIANV